MVDKKGATMEKLRELVEKGSIKANKYIETWGEKRFMEEIMKP